MLLGVALLFWVIVTQARVLIGLFWIVLGAALLSLALRPVIGFFARYWVPPGLTVVITYGLGVASIGLLGGLIAPVLGAEAGQLRQNGPQILGNLQAYLAQSPLARWLPDGNTLAQNIGQQLGALLGTAFGTVAGAGGLFLDALVLLILAYFFATQSDWLGGLLTRWSPPSRREEIDRYLSQVRHYLTRWLYGQLLLALFTAAFFAIGLWLMRVPSSLTLGLISGVLSLVPYLGLIGALLLAAASALTVSPGLALWVAALYLVGALVTGHIVAPILYGRAMGLRSAVVLLALYLGARTAGVLGVVFAGPIVVMVAAALEAIQPAAGPNPPGDMP